MTQDRNMRALLHFSCSCMPKLNPPVNFSCKTLPRPILFSVSTAAIQRNYMSFHAFPIISIYFVDWIIFQGLESNQLSLLCLKPFRVFLSQAGPQDLTLITHLLTHYILILTKLSLTFFLKLFFPVYLNSGKWNPKTPLRWWWQPWQNFLLAQTTQTFWAKCPTHACTDGPWGDLWNDLILPLFH